MPHSLSDQGLPAHLNDLPPEYPANERQNGDLHRQLHSPSLDVVRHQTQGGFVPANVTGNVPAKLYLDLNQPNRYKAGDTVSGSVQLASKLDGGREVAVGSISITFTGRCTTTKPIRDSPARRRTLQIFSQKEILLTGPTRLHAPHKSALGGSCPRFDFQFQFPSNCNMPEVQDFETGPFFNSDAHQPLPPSFADESQVDKASVVYELRWELLAPGSEGYYMQGSFSQNEILNVYTPRTVQDPMVKFTPHSKSFTHQSLELLPPEERKYHQRPLTLGQKLGITSISTERQPKASFTVTVLIPSIAIIGQPLPLMLHVDHDAGNSTVAVPPIVHLIKVQVFLRVETSICAMKQRYMESEPDQTGWTTTAQIGVKEFIQALPRIEHLDLRKVMSLNFDPKLSPSFRSFSIARTYSLKVAGTIKCGGRSFAIWSPMTRCILLAKEYAPHLPGYDEPSPTVDQEDSQLTDEMPPSYANYVQLEVPQRPRTLHYGPSSRSSSPNHALRNYAATASASASATSETSLAAHSAASSGGSINGGGGSGGGGGGC